MADNDKMTMSLPAKLRVSAMIKEALDNLPCGVCFFDENGIPMLVNRVMHRLAFSLTGRDIQDISDLEKIMNSPDEIAVKDGTVWRFAKKTSDTDNITEINAADITELSAKKQELKNSNAEQQDIMRRLENLSKNVVSATRNEEILSMKMRVHSELGYALGATRHFILEGIRKSEKSEYIELQRRMAKKLMGEVGNDDETDIFSELKENAEKLGMEIVFEGELPRYAEEFMTKAVRECLINTFRHAHGDRVFVKAEISEGKYTAVITNNGESPKQPVTEGGGLSSLRKNIERGGGSMTVSCRPEFSLTVTLNEKEQQND